MADYRLNARDAGAAGAPELRTGDTVGRMMILSITPESLVMRHRLTFLVCDALLSLACLLAAGIVLGLLFNAGRQFSPMGIMTMVFFAVLLIWVYDSLTKLARRDTVRIDQGTKVMEFHARGASPRKVPAGEIDAVMILLLKESAYTVLLREKNGSAHPLDIGASVVEARATRTLSLACAMAERMGCPLLFPDVPTRASAEVRHLTHRMISLSRLLRGDPDVGDSSTGLRVRGEPFGTPAVLRGVAGSTLVFHCKGCGAAGALGQVRTCEEQRKLFFLVPVGTYEETKVVCTNCSREWEVPIGADALCQVSPEAVGDVLRRPSRAPAVAAGVALVLSWIPGVGIVAVGLSTCMKGSRNGRTRLINALAACIGVAVTGSVALAILIG
jgi:hypothetical protein